MLRRRPSWLQATVMDDREAARRGLRAAAQLGRTDSMWPGQVAVAAALALYFVLPPKLTPGPGRLLALVEAGLLVALLIASSPGRERSLSKDVALAFLSVVTVTNLVSLGLLVHFLLAGGKANGADLVGGGVVIWSTNLLIFAVWYWELDRGGPVRQGEDRAIVVPDFLFPQMTAQEYSAPGWKPTFGDYLYVSLTNQSAFSPTDTMPLTVRVKILMGIQGIASLVTVGIIVARAVNVLGA